MNKNEKWIWFDMDGTIADLYGVEGWLDDLINLNTRPYAKADLLYDNADFLYTLGLLRQNGYHIGVISWGSKANNAEFDKAVEYVKKEWLYEKCISDFLDKIIVTAYGVCKADTCRKYGSGILVDDEEQNRNAWDLGRTINANNDIIKALKALV
jgi:hypothetical protein